MEYVHRLISGLYYLSTYLPNSLPCISANNLLICASSHGYQYFMTRPGFLQGVRLSYSFCRRLGNLLEMPNFANLKIGPVLLSSYVFHG